MTEYVRTVGTWGGGVSPLVLRSLKQARYDPRNLGHSGLASPAYCHFTSPIRRYPDLVCPPRAAAGAGRRGRARRPTTCLSSPSTRRRVSATATEIEYRPTRSAWRGCSNALFELGWEHAFEGEIAGVIGSGMFVRFGEVFEGYVPARRLPGDYFELNALGTALVGRRGGRAYRLGDPIAFRSRRSSVRGQGRALSPA